MTQDGRTLHYGHFYGIDSDLSDTRPLLLVWGNCQAEALRVVLASAPNNPYRTVRVPPVHELTASDLPHLERLLESTDTVLSQPVRAGYRGLPIGTSDIAGRPSIAATITWPVIRYAGLCPFQIIVRHPSDPSAVPPVVPYHDLRTVLAFARGHSQADGWEADVTADGIRAARDWSIAELERREQRDCDFAISDVLIPLGAAAAHTINHPGNAVLIELGSRILAALDGGAPGEIDRELLGNVRAPLDRRVIDALGLDAPVRESWTVDAADVSEQRVRSAQMAWYEAHPQFVEAACTRYRELIDLLGLSV